MITVPLAKVLDLLKATKGKSPDQIEVEAEVRAMLAARKIERLTQAELEALYEEAGMSVALLKLAAKMKTGIAPEMH